MAQNSLKFNNKNIIVVCGKSIPIMTTLKPNKIDVAKDIFFFTFIIIKEKLSDFLLIKKENQIRSNFSISSVK